MKQTIFYNGYRYKMVENPERTPEQKNKLYWCALRYVAMKRFPQIEDADNFICSGALQINNTFGVEIARDERFEYMAKSLWSDIKGRVFATVQIIDKETECDDIRDYFVE